MSIRTALNAPNLNQLADNFNQMELGELLSHLIAIATPTEAGVVPVADVATLANVPSAIFQVNATAAAVTGIKKLLRGKITGAGAVVPATGECVWEPGTTSILFAAVDAVTAVSTLYARATTSTSSCMLRNPDETY